MDLDTLLLLAPGIRHGIRCFFIALNNRPGNQCFLCDVAKEETAEDTGGRVVDNCDENSQKASSQCLQFVFASCRNLVEKNPTKPVGRFSNKFEISFAEMFHV